METLNVRTLPLDKKNLIEASAGTGKTFTIGLIVLRLLLREEFPLTIEKIVLITFTDSAALELQRKTAEKILGAYKMWEENSFKDNDDFSFIIKEAKDSKNAQIKKANLLDAIARIDEMPVFTIHGFCRRLLGEFSFETGSFEKKDIITDQSNIERIITADFWRREVKTLSEHDIEILPEGFSPGSLTVGINKVINFPNARLSYESEQVTTEGDILAAKLQYKFANEYNAALRKEKERLKVMSFSDLIQNTYEAVESDSDKILYNAVQKRYGAILIDEFQDTDKMQYKIFCYLFDNKPFFMIGDPKQAIYKFRGGDVYAYINAKSKLEETPKTIDKNFRSQEKLLSALNKIFDIDNPFENKNIEYIKVTPGLNLPPLKINDKEQKPFILRNIEYRNKQELYVVKEDIISEITRLLYETQTEIYDKEINDYRKLKANDIAILSRTNDLAKEYRNALKNNKDISIPAVIRRSDSVLESEAAEYLMRLLTAFVNYKKENCIRAALMENKELSVSEIKPFVDAYDNWKKYGIMWAINNFFDECKIWGKILSKKNGERNATNLRQLIGILNNEENVLGRVPERMLRHFSELFGSASEESEEKLETDDDAVQIMTIHKSKGLQFPVVFVPDIMLTGEGKYKDYAKLPPVYHDDDDIVIEYEISNRKKGTSNAKAKEKLEDLEESARNFYVAVTRPIYRLYVVNSYKTTRSYERSKGQFICSQITKDENIEIVDNSFLEIEYPESSEEKTEDENTKLLFQPKPLPGKIEPSWERTSFTAISQNLEHTDNIPVYHKTEIEPPAGKRMGTLLHCIFENLDFDADEEEIKNMIENNIGGYREFSMETGERRKIWIREKVKAILNKDLPGAGKLCDITADNKAAELHFFMKSENMSLLKIKEIMDTKINAFETGSLTARYIKGAIDLVFLGKDGKYYILDWKSNSINDFSKEGMEKEAMLPHGYHLQYYIYAVALKRWLEKTKRNFDFKKQFGGAYYIFIRGVTDKDDNFDGIYFADGKEITDGIIKMDNCFTGVCK
jgi:exodeoxyribonuclease V beta subunit